MGSACESCGSDMTSPAKSDDVSDCIKVTSNCNVGFYGPNDNCKKCPNGQTSAKNTVNVKDCFEDPDAEENTGKF